MICMQGSQLVLRPPSPSTSLKLQRTLNIASVHTDARMSWLPRHGLSRPHFRRRSSAGGRSESGSEEDTSSTASIPHADVFLDDQLPTEYFKQDLLKLIHQLHVPRWIAVSSESSEDIILERINGALTNSVYKVMAPPYVKERIKRENEARAYHHKVPSNLLLRVYGPQVHMLIDRKKELDTVAQLTQVKIGAKLLGTFANGRFEQFLNAKALSRQELRNPEISKLIAKRMRDLHDNIPVSSVSREEGPQAWSMVDRWEPAAREKLKQLDKATPGTSVQILGTEIERFFSSLQTYRTWLQSSYSSEAELARQLVFAHNDTQYGNILRLEPPPGSPLLRPQNEHRQLVVIDFEYSGPNVRAYDIANHFCEWMSDYHHPTMPYHIWTDRYPNEEEQMIFINSYVEHASQDFDDVALEQEGRTLYESAKLWRPAVSAFWAIWGIIQAPFATDIEEREQLLRRNGSYDFGVASPDGPREKIEIQDDSFDYVRYATEKVKLFWEDYAALNVEAGGNLVNPTQTTPA